jgi:Flp pilus assembly protein TadG
MSPETYAEARSELGLGGRCVKRFLNDRGTATIELAIVLPILLMVMFGIAEFGIFFTQPQAITIAAHNGARYATVHPTAWSNAASPPANTIEGQILVGQNSSAIPNDDSHTSIVYQVISGSTATTCGHYSATSGFVAASGCSQSTSVVSGSLIQVTITYTYHVLTPVFQTMFPSGLTFSPGASMLEEV